MGLRQVKKNLVWEPKS